ncbi:hypothetical protein [Carboxylicivirga sp. N1Y90]|uniref:hypothetical protein n=1 Tax=Carboxylicivirga fragile TaxID=3417571 RepID=UPI003D344885|nr:hypothetical protein [Marinilabiliaceae bacterium N1Y90]
MKKNITYKILPQINIVVEYFSGPIHISDMIAHKKDIIKNIEFYPNINFIADLRDSQLLYTKQELSEYVGFIKEEKKLNTHRKTAILTSTPQQVAQSTIYESLTKDLPIRFKIFSTLQATLEWVSVKKGLEFSMIEGTILKLKNESSVRSHYSKVLQRQ